MNDNVTSMCGVELPIALTFDLDPDHFDPSMGDEYATADMSWRGVETAVPALADILASYHDDFGNRACATWLPRADSQISALYGDAGAVLDRFDGLLRACANAGDEIAWHPHLHKNVDGTWIQETDPAALHTDLVTAHHAMTSHGWNPRSIRIGGNYGSNALMASLDELGIKVDSSALPGRSRDDHHYALDWSTTTQAAYRPAEHDYRVPGTPARAIIEVPVTMTPVRADYDAQAYSRYVDLSFHPRALQPALETTLSTVAYLVSDTHPSTVLPEIAAARPHGLLSFSLTSFKSNLDAIVECCARLRRPVRFVALSDPCLRPA